MKKYIILALTFIGLSSFLFGQAPTLGVYSNTSVVAGSNISITPSSTPTNTTSISAFTNTNFTGVFTVDPVTGMVKVTDAKQAGVFPVTVKAFGPGGTITSAFTLTVTNPYCSQGFFATAVDIAAGALTFSVAVGDFNNDGNQDCASANQGTSDVSILTGDGAGGFMVTSSVAAGNGPRGVAIGDFNGDGNQDLAIANVGGGDVSIRMGDGLGGFSGTSSVSVGLQPITVKTGDFNGDGNLDLATPNYGWNSVSIRLGDGLGGFSGTANFSVGTQPFSVAIGDFNGDGNQDFAAANYSSANVTIRLGDGLGGFGAASNIAVGTQPVDVTIGDFNEDGNQDLAVANFGSNTVSIRLGNGAGGFSGTTNVSVGSGPHCATLGDFNGDGDLDFATSDFNMELVDIRLGNGLGGFNGTYGFSVGFNPQYSAVGDFNEDGRFDLAVANYGSNSVSIVLAVATEINVQGNLTNIFDGDITPSPTDHTDFGSVATCFGTITRTYTIQNTGTASLSVSGVSITGTNAADFSVGVAPAASVVAGGSTFFQVIFDPSLAGVRTATINITNNDCDENPYNFAIQGSGNFNTPPVAICRNLTGYLNGSGTFNIVPPMMNNGSYDECGIASMSVNISSLNCSNIGPNNVTLTVIDTDGASATCTGVVTVADSTHPSLSCPGNFIVATSPTTCSAIVTFATPVATDNCSSVTVTQLAGLPSGSAFPLGVTTNTFRATDGSGNSTTCSFTVTVNDTQAPVLYTSSCSSSNAAATAYSDGWQSGDNDGSGFSSWTLTASTGNTAQAGFLIGSSITNGVGTDSNGDQDINTSGNAWGMYANSSQGAQAVRSLLSPLSFGSSVTAEFDNGFVDPGQIVGFQIQNSAGLSLGEIRYRGGQAGYEIVDANGITPFASIPFTDEGIIIEVTSVSTGIANIKLTRKVNGATQTIVSTLFPGGGNQVIQKVKIFNSNVGSGLTKYLYVNKLQMCALVAGCPANIIASTNAGTCSSVVTYVAPVGVDNCSVVTTTQTAGLPSGSTFPLGVTTNTFRAVDGSGNISTCSFTVTVNDVEPPTALCNDTTLFISSSGNLVITPGALNQGSFDACGIASMSVFPNTFSCSQVAFGQPVTLTVTDVNGNSSTCVSLVNIYENLAPIAICQNVSAYLDASGNSTVTTTMVNNGSYDECSIAMYRLQPFNTSFGIYNCSNVGTNTVTLQVFDTFGQIGSCTSTVTVIDTIRPVASCQNVTVTLSGGIATVAATAINNGSTDACGIASMSVSPNTFDCTNLGPNTVTFTVLDNNGNSSTCTSVVTVLSNFTSSVAVNSNVSCNGGSNGQATVSTVGGAGPFTYLWSPSGGTAATSTGLVASVYTCTITDAGGCTTSQTVSITQPTALVASAASQTNISCNAGSNGAASVSITGGTTAYSYNWTPGNPTGDGTASVTGLTFGTWTCTVTDANSCTTTQTFNITQPTVVAASSSATSILCNGGNATVTVTGSGGTSPYTGTGTFTVTAGGPYSYTVTDNNGCTATTTITVTQPTVVAAGSTATSILCNGGNATVTVTGTGGTSPYIGTGTFTVTAGGPYSYTVTDNNGCTATTTITVTQPTVVAAGSTATSILCNGGNATVTVTGSGGTSPYTGTGSFTVTAGGPYSYTVTDNNGCTATTTITVTEPTILAASSTATSILCNGGNATVTVTGSGGTSPYTGTGTFTVTAGGPYSYVVTDGNGCAIISTITVTEPAVLVATVTSTTNPTTCGGTDGVIDISVTGGMTAYTFLWSNAATTEDLSAVGAGAYNCTITDANGCTTTTSANLNDPNAPTVTLALTLDTACQTTTAPFTLTGESPAGGTFSGPGVTANTFDPMTANLGINMISYTYTDINGCTGSAVDSIWVDLCMGINPAIANINFTVMPNPNNGAFVLQLNTTQAADVLIYDALGQLVSKQKVQPKTQQQLFIASSGVYLITVITADGQRSTQRVIVSK